MHPDHQHTAPLLKAKSIALKKHSIFSCIHSLDDLRHFMHWHVFAVWDFMSLVKRLQHELTCVHLPWTPAKYPFAARLINEIVLGEESDETPSGTHTSHFELYLTAMKEVGANTVQIEYFISLIRSNIATDIAFKMADVPIPVQNFVLSTIHLAKNGSVFEVLGSFLYGREDAIPQMFQTLLNDWSIPQQKTPTFVYYLQRHIALDGDSHGPAAINLADKITNGNPHQMESIQQAGILAIEQRLALWDALKSELNHKREIANDKALT